MMSTCLRIISIDWRVDRLEKKKIQNSMRIGVQTQNVICDDCPSEGFQLLKTVGFSCVDFSLNGYLKNIDIYNFNMNSFFQKSIGELEDFFSPHKRAAEKFGISIHQMHMPYPIYVPGAEKEMNTFLWNEVASKSMQLCSFFDCRYIVVHGFKLSRFLGSEELEWEQTQRFIDYIAPMAKEMGITICVENLYDSVQGHLVEGPCCNADKSVERIDRINEKYKAEVLGFCFDTGHANLVGIDFEEFIIKLGNRLKVTHIHDNDGNADLHQIPYTFTRTRENQASTDWVGFITGLHKIGYKGVLNFETAPVLKAFPKEMKEDVLRFIVKIGENFRACIEPGRR